MMKKIISVETMDRLQREIGKELESTLERVLQKKVRVSYINLGYGVATRGLIVDIYKNKYDFKQIRFIFKEDSTLDMYVRLTVYALQNKECREYTASLLEKYIVDMLEKYDCEDTYTYENALMYRGEDICLLNDVDNFMFHKEEGRITIIDDREKYIIDLDDDTVECIDLDDILEFTKEEVEWIKSDVERIMKIYRSNDADKVRDIVDHIGGEAIDTVKMLACKDSVVNIEVINTNDVVNRRTIDYLWDASMNCFVDMDIYTADELRELELDEVYCRLYEKIYNYYQNIEA